MRKKYSYYEYETFYEELPQLSGWGYKIYTDSSIYNEIWQTDLYRESEELFESEQKAEFAAIGHISLIENGEG